MSRIECRTAPPERSIWLDIPENTFRQHLVDLEQCTNAVPLDPQIFPLADDQTSYEYTLPVRIEQQLADDLAFLAAIEEGAQSVAAVCLEEHEQPARLTVRFAALDLSLSEDMKSALQNILDSLAMNSSPTSAGKDTQMEEIFEKIVQLHFRRLLARFRSHKWEKPKYLARQHKKPLWQDFRNLIHRVQFLYLKRESKSRRAVEDRLQQLASVYESFETTEADVQHGTTALQGLIKESYVLCKDDNVREFARRLDASVNTTPTAKVASAIKCLRQIEKIGTYWRIAASLVDTSLRYPSLFHSKPEIAFLTPYSGVPTSIGYESWATTVHVHAEVQLAVYYDIQQQSQASRLGFRPPRVIGTSKWLCYLCYLFLRFHGRFLPANTHGRLYDQWTVPDLAEYEETLCTRYRGIIAAIDKEVLREADNTPQSEEESSLVRWRAEPMTSRQNLFSADSAV